MEKALHPKTLKKITLAEYKMDYGNTAPACNEERPFCPFCGQRMTPVAASTPGTRGHFAHLPKSSFCPTKDSSGAGYKNFTPASPDEDAASNMKQYFRRNWKIHFSQLDYLVKGLSKKEFFEVIQFADTARIWEYSRLEYFHIPYVLATLMDFPPEKSLTIKGIPKRKNYFRCFFDATVRKYDDLWIDRPKDLNFWRAWYSVPQGRKPRIEHLIDAYASPLSNDFLGFNPNVPPFYIEEIQDWIDHRYLPKHQ